MDVDKIYSVIIIYNADISALTTLTNSLKAQDSNVVLVVNDNNKYNSINADKVIYNKKNLGIAEAQNIGIKYSLCQGAEFVAIFDQDSKVPKDYLSKMKDAFYVAQEEIGNIGLVAPRIYDINMDGFLEPRIYNFNKNRLSINIPNEKEKKVLNNKLIRLAAKPIASGALISQKTFKKVGFMDERLFIDLVDTDYDLRILLNGMNIVQANSIILRHKIGNRKEVKFGKFSIWPTNHSPMRRYTIARNTIWLWKKYRKNIKGMNKETFRTIISNIVYIQFETDAFSKNKAFLKGLIGGIFENGQ